MEHWSIRKPAVHTQGGVVVAQHALAAEAGAKVLARGGNAVDAAITAGFALSAVEPWTVTASTAEVLLGEAKDLDLAQEGRWTRDEAMREFSVTVDKP